MRRALLVLMLALMWGMPAHAQQRQLQDVIYLKDGGVVRGTVVEIVPNESVLIQTADLSRFRYRMDQIERMAKEPAPPVTTRRSPAVAGVLSGLIMGAGHAYNGQWGKGLLFFGGGAVLIAATENGDDPGVWALSFVTLYVVNIADAVQSARRINVRLQPPTTVAPGRIGLSLSMPVR